MNSITRTVFAFLLVWSMQSCIIVHPKEEDCEQKQIVVTSITEGPAYDIVFHTEDGQFYYINRGLENGLELAPLRDSLLNKSVNLHLANTLVGSSNHIAQLSLDNRVIYSEFD